MPSEFTHKLVVVRRRDLKLSPGKLAVQTAHAAVTCTLQARQDSKKALDAWLREGQKKVLVEGEDLRHLHELKVMAEDLGLPTSLVTDAGRTEVEPGTVTVLGIGPGANATVDRVTGGLRLV